MEQGALRNRPQDGGPEELALLVGLSLTLLLCLWLDREQSELAQDVLRLHVLANSDSEADQALKLKLMQFKEASQM